jgi:hypothetical protein
MIAIYPWFLNFRPESAVTIVSAPAPFVLDSLVKIEGKQDRETL